jgi:hypothetical protein
MGWKTAFEVQQCVFETQQRLLPFVSLILAVALLVESQLLYHPNELTKLLPKCLDLRLEALYVLH